MKEWNKYLELLKIFNKKKIIKLIKNQNRLIDANIYISGYNTKKNRVFNNKRFYEYNIIFNIYIMKIIILY